MKSRLALLLIGMLSSTLASAIDTQCWVHGPYGRTAAQEVACKQALAERVNNEALQNAARSAEIEKLTRANEQSVVECSAGLSMESDTIDVSKALSCLRSNPYAGDEAVDAFGTAYASLIERLSSGSPELRADFDVLQANKRKRLYWSVVSQRGKVIIVGEKYVFGNPIVQARDLSALDLRVVATSRIFGDDELVPFDQFKAITYRASPHSKDGSIGMNELTLSSGKVLTDASYQAMYPIKHHYGDKWAALVQVVGTGYVDSERGAMLKPSSVLPLKQTEMSGATITLLDPEVAAREIAAIEAKIRATEAKADAEEQKVRAERMVLIERLQRASKGDEDSCQGRVSANKPLSDTMAVSCQFLKGTIELGMLKEQGWLITNVSHLNDGNGTALIGIRKAR
jgi:hypothetical protein